MATTPDDDTLMVAIAKGEETAFRLLVQRWETDVKSFLVHMTGSVEEAQDLTQDTFVQVFRKAGGYHPDGKFKSWLFRIAGNFARSNLRRRKIIGWVSFNPDYHDRAEKQDDQADHLAAQEDSVAIKSALDRLPRRQKEALVLHRFQGMKYRDIAAAMGTTVPGVESLIQRAMAGLRKDLAGKVDRS